MKINNWLPDKLGQDIWSKKYQHNNETLDEWFDRVSNGNEELKQLIIDKKFLFGGRTLSNRHTNKGSYSNCYSEGYVNDSLKDIMQTTTNLALTYKSQGGEGVSLSKIRPKDAPITNGYVSDGIVPWMRLFNTTTESISQAGSRKGALLMSLDITHRDAKTFITIKNDLDEINKANLSLEIDDEFMNWVKNGSIQEFITRTYDSGTIEYVIDPTGLYNLMITQAWKNAEPGVLFMNKFKNYNIMEFVDDFVIESCNACFTGNMNLLTENGYMTFEELCDTQPNIINNIGNITKSKVWCSGKKETVSLNFYGKKQSITCTSDHIFKLIDGSEVEAKNLQGKRLMPFLKDTYTDDLYKKLDLKELILLKSYKVSSITNNGIQKVYDFTEPETHWGIVNDVIVHNCSEQPLPKFGSCNLASINLSNYVVNPFFKDSYIEYANLINDIRIFIREMDKTIDENMNNHPLQQQRDSVEKWRNLGLGTMGYADMLIKLELKYGSVKAQEVTATLYKCIFRTSVETSVELAREFGSFPGYNEKVFDSTIMKAHFSKKELEHFKKIGLRNASLVSIAPTGSIATMLGISTGIEPVFAFSHTRKTESLNNNEETYYKIDSEIVKEYKKIFPNNKLPNYFISSHNIKWRDKIDVLSIIQESTDTAISSTTNLKSDITLDEVKELYMYAWEKGLKGTTIYRDGSRDGILTTSNQIKENSSLTLNRPKSIPCDIHNVKINGEQWTIIIGLLNNSPYEVFAFKNKNIHIKDVTNSHLFKKKIDGVNHYSITSNNVNITDLPQLYDTGEEEFITRLISRLVRLDKIDTVIQDAEKTYKNIGTFVNVIKRILSKYTTQNIISKDICPECGEQLRMVEGCKSCDNCGYSKCG